MEIKNDTSDIGRFGVEDWKIIFDRRFYILSAKNVKFFAQGFNILNDKILYGGKAQDEWLRRGDYPLGMRNLQWGFLEE
jgi:hypothetical protein